MNRFFGAALSLLLLSACATDYTPPKERAPDNWYLPTGLASDTSSLEITQGPVELGGELFRMNALPVTAGQLKNDVRWGKDGEFMLPAGTRVYANQFTLVRTSNYASTVNMNKNNDPIEWCAMGPKDRPVCIFFHSPTEALYITGSGVPAKARMITTMGELGDLPEIVIGVDKDADMHQLITTYKKARKQNMRVFTTVHWRGKASPLTNHVIREWDEDGKARIFIGPRSLPLRLTEKGTGYNVYRTPVRRLLSLRVTRMLDEDGNISSVTIEKAQPAKQENKDEETVSP